MEPPKIALLPTLVDKAREHAAERSPSWGQEFFWAPSTKPRPRTCRAVRASLFLLPLIAPIAYAAESFHAKFNWRAEDYFDDPQVVALCHAIEADDLAEIDRLAAAGADVNAKGKGNMTPLLWAYPDNKPARFKRLLEHGADPNVIFESDFNTRGLGIRPGDAITHLVCETTFPHYFDYVFQHGGDPNLWNRDEHKYPLHFLIRGPATDKNQKVKRLIELGADLDANIDNEFTGNATPVRVAVSCFGQYDLALMLLESGANFTSYRPNSNSKLAHTVAREAKRLPRVSSKQREDYYALVAWLEEHGESIKEATEDLERWKSWSSQGKTHLIDREVSEREAREQAAAESKAAEAR